MEEISRAFGLLSKQESNNVTHDLTHVGTYEEDCVKLAYKISNLARDSINCVLRSAFFNVSTYDRSSVLVDGVATCEHSFVIAFPYGVFYNQELVRRIPNLLTEDIQCFVISNMPRTLSGDILRETMWQGSILPIKDCLFEMHTKLDRDNVVQVYTTTKVCVDM